MIMAIQYIAFHLPLLQRLPFRRLSWDDREFLEEAFALMKQRNHDGSRTERIGAFQFLWILAA